MTVWPLVVWKFAWFFDAFLFLCERSSVSLRTTGPNCSHFVKTNFQTLRAWTPEIGSRLSYMRGIRRLHDDVDFLSSPRVIKLALPSSFAFYARLCSFLAFPRDILTISRLTFYFLVIFPRYLLAIPLFLPLFFPFRFKFAGQNTLTLILFDSHLETWSSMSHDVFSCWRHRLSWILLAFDCFYLLFCSLLLHESLFRGWYPWLTKLFSFSHFSLWSWMLWRNTPSAIHSTSVSCVPSSFKLHQAS